MKATSLAKLALLAMLAVGGMRPARAQEQGSATLERQFRTLPIEARRLTGPLYWLHGDESKAQLEGELQKVVEGGNGTFTAESRPHADWLGEGWYRDLGICLDFAKKHDLTMWIFDEKWWPSGEVGGKVPQQYGSKMLQAEAAEVAGPKRVELEGFGTNLIAAIAARTNDLGVDGASLVDLTDKVRDGKLAWDAPAGAWKVMKFTWAWGPKRRGNVLVDGASREAVDWYIKTVYQPHYDRFKQDFGKTIQGYFYDEPETPGDWGSEVIPLLKARGVDWRKALVAWKFKLAGEEQAAAKYQYQDALAEAWGKTLYGGLSEWCKAHGVISMGHFLEHNWEYLKPDLCAGNMFQLQKYSDMGAIDLVFKQMPPGTRPMGMYQMAKLGSSISHAYGKQDDIAMVEIYGARGQDLPYPEMKWQVDQMQVRGINFLIPHSFNPRAPYDTDCPPYFYNGGFEPRWPLYRVFADYTSRLSLMLTGGRHACPVALLFAGNSAHVGKTVLPEELTSTLQDALFDCDWMPYDVFENDTKLAGKEIGLREERYRVLIVPPVEVIPAGTLEKAKAFFEQGGVVVGYGFLPTKSATLGQGDKAIGALTEAIWGKDAKPGLKALKTSAAGGRAYLLPEKPAAAEIQQALAGDAGVHPALEVLEGETGGWLHVLHRVKAGKDIFFVANQNLEGGARKFRFKVRAEGEPECWDAMRGEITAVDYKRVAKGEVEIALTLEPYESVLLVFQKDKRDLPLRLEGEAKPVREITVTRDASVPEPPRPAIQEAKQADTLEGCAWVWFPEKGVQGNTAPPGTRYLRGWITVPEGQAVKKASFTLSADNGFAMEINGARAGKSNPGTESWRTAKTIDITRRLKPGRNLVALTVTNATDKPSPAGVIGKYQITMMNDSTVSGAIDTGWKTWDKKLPGWDQEGFHDAGWPNARMVARYAEEPWGRLNGRARLTLSPAKANPFNGKAAVPAEVNLKQARVYLVCEGIAPEAAARVTVNGKDAGGFIEKPLRLEIGKYLKTGEDTIRIEPFAPQSVKLAVYP